MTNLELQGKDLHEELDRFLANPNKQRREFLLLSLECYINDFIDYHSKPLDKPIKT